MGRFGFVGASYTAKSTAVADEECINLYAETVESQGAITPAKTYGGSTAQGLKSYFGTPGLTVFTNFGTGNVPRGTIYANGQLFAVAGTGFYQVASTGVATLIGNVANDGNAASLAFNSVQILIVSGGRAYCYTLATNALLDVTGLLAGVPVRVDEADTYFIVCFQNSNKFQMSQLLDGTTWPGQLVNIPSVFPENIRSVIVNHRELWVFGSRHCQPYQNTGSLEVFDPIGGTLIETGCVATFAPVRLDNSVFWISEDERGGRMAWRSNGYTPQRVSTHAVETDLSSYTTAQIASLVTYSYQDGGHLFWVLYIPGSTWSWVYDVNEQLWHKRQSGLPTKSGPHWSWNHVYAFGLHLVGDWNSGNLYQMSLTALTDNGTAIRRVRRAPTIMDEMKWIAHAELTVDFSTGLGLQPPLTDGNGNPRQPEAMLRWSDDRGNTWSNEHIAGLGFAGQYTTRAIWRRLGRSRYRVYELSITDPIPVAIVDAYLRTV